MRCSTVREWGSVERRVICSPFLAAFTVGTVAIFVITESRGLSGLPAAIGMRMSATL